MLRYPSCMRDECTIRTGEDLLRLIAPAVRLQVACLSENEAMAVTDTVLRAQGSGVDAHAAERSLRKLLSPVTRLLG